MPERKPTVAIFAADKTSQRLSAAIDQNVFAIETFSTAVFRELQFDPKAFDGIVFAKKSIPKEALQVIRQCKTSKRHRQFVIVVSDKAADAKDVLIEGADDHLVKSRVNEDLQARMEVRWKQTQQLRRLMAAKDALRDLAEHDDLTNLYNMRSMYSRIDKEIKRALRYERELTAVMLDIDHFKKVNDLQNHLFGSHVLQILGGMISDNLRKDIDFAARYGGDEFLVVLPETSVKGAFVFADRLRERVEQREFSDDRDCVRLTASFGLASLSMLGNEPTARELVLRADEALYMAKEQGRNRVVAYKEQPVRLTGS